MKQIIKILLVISLLIIEGQVEAEIALPSVIGDNMVLQQKTRVKIWGWSGPADLISVTPSWTNITDTVTADHHAKWELYLDTPDAGGPFTLTIGCREEKVRLRNIMIGEVWFCSGQSNMESSYNYLGIKETGSEAITGYNPNVRFCKIRKTTSKYPQENCMAKWVICDSISIKDISAIAYYFAKKLNGELNVPIGIIQSAWGGTAIETWIPADIINNNSVFKRSAEMQKSYPWWPCESGFVYNAMVAPVTNFSIAGSIWYQGESNVSYPSAYLSLMSSMIDEWRKSWNKEFPFYYVQIAPFNKYVKDSAAYLREAQMKCLINKNVGMVVVSDIVDDVSDIHPQNKHDVGYRLANLALSKTYRLQGIAWNCPTYEKMEIMKNRVVLHFDDEIMVTGNKANELFVAGDDKIFHPADAKADGNKLIVTSKHVKAPVAVRYSFSNEGIGNLFSNEKLPVSPFRTDNWAKWQMGNY